MHLELKGVQTIQLRGLRCHPVIECSNLKVSCCFCNFSVGRSFESFCYM